METEVEVTPEIAAFMEHATETATPDIMRSTTPIFSLANGSPYLLGTGFFLEVADKCFLVTAAHNLDMFGIHHQPFFLPPHAGHSTPISVGDVYLSMTPMPVGMRPEDDEMRRYDPLDTGVVPLSKSVTDQLRPHYHFNRLLDADPNPRQPNGLFLVCGFPAQLTDEFGMANPICLTTAQCSAETQYASPFSIFLSYPQVIHHSGVAVEAPDPVGMSGCGVWRIADSITPYDHWKPADVRLVGVQHKFEPGQYLHCTSIKIALQLIYHETPSLRSSMELTHPWLPEACRYMRFRSQSSVHASKF